MKFLLNMNVPRQLGKGLASQNHDWRHAGDIGLAKATDEVIIEEARKHREVIITHDLDYSHILAFSGEKTPSVIIFRLRNSHPSNLLNRFVKVWASMQEPLQKGAVVSLEDAALRVRMLPILLDE